MIVIHKQFVYFHFKTDYWKYSRDFERTPMQWNNETYCGFSTETPWLQVANNCQTRNVEVTNLETVNSLFIIFYFTPSIFMMVLLIFSTSEPKKILISTFIKNWSNCTAKILSYMVTCFSHISRATYSPSLELFHQTAPSLAMPS